MKKAYLLCMVLLSAGISLQSSCSPAPVVDKGTVVFSATPQSRLNISGSEDVAAVLEVCSDSFQESVPTYRLRILSGSGVEPSIRGVLEGVLDMAAMNRLPTPAEKALGLKFFEFGEVSVVVFTHPGVGIANLTSDQVRGIFTGKVTNWKMLGGPDLAIVPYVRSEDSGNTQVLRKMVLRNVQFSDTAEVINSGDAMRTAVAVTTGSIGYGAWPPVQATGINVQAVALDNVKPDDPNYPLTSIFGIGYLADREKKIVPFIDWLQSPAGKARLMNFGVIIRQGQ